MSKRVSTGEHVKVPTVKFRNEEWGDLSVFGTRHDFVCTSHNQGRDISFIDDHRVRTFTFKKMVHWKIPAGTELDITEVGQARRRAQTR